MLVGLVMEMFTVLAVTFLVQTVLVTERPSTFAASAVILTDLFGLSVTMVTRPS